MNRHIVNYFHIFINIENTIIKEMKEYFRIIKSNQKLSFTGFIFNNSFFQGSQSKACAMGFC